MNFSWLQALGWGGSALLVFSLLQTRVLRFRILNLAACVALVVFNALVAVWPMAAMNLVLSLINIWFIVTLVQESKDETAYTVVPVAPDDAYLTHVLQVHGGDIARFQPDLDWQPKTPGAAAYLVLKADETVGVILMQVRDTVAHVLLDYVTQRYRDFSPGEFVWRRSDLLRDRGLTRVVTPPHMVGAYYSRLGFKPEGPSYVLDVA